MFSKDKTKTKSTSFLGALFHGAAFYIFMVVLFVGIILGFKVYSQEKGVNVVANNTINIRLGDEVELKFSTEMLQRSIEESITIEPKLRFRTKWKSQKLLQVEIIESPKPDSVYIICIDGAKTKFYIPQKKIVKELISPKSPKLESVYPKDGQTDLEVEDTIVINLDREIEDPFSLEVEIAPPTTGFDYKFNAAKTQLIITPIPKMKEKTEYRIFVKLKHVHIGSTESLYGGSFTTKPPPPVFYNYVFGNSNAKTEERLENVDPQILRGKYLDIDISSQTMFLFHDGKEMGAFKVSTGKRGMDTPLGVFRVMAKSQRPWSKKYSLFMPWFLQFTSEGHGIHELPEWPSGYKEGTNHLGIPVSHGCVRLGVGPARVVYSFVEINTPIIIHQ